MQSEANLNGVESGMVDLTINQEAKKNILDSRRAVTGVLTSRPTSRDIKIDGFSMGLNGVELIQDCSIELTIGRRYGLIGANGSGKTNFLECLANREVRPCHLLTPSDNNRGVCIPEKLHFACMLVPHHTAYRPHTS